MTYNIVVSNTKGGVGKSTSAMYIGSALADQDYIVTMVDADPQGSLTSWYQKIETEELSARRISLSRSMRRTYKRSDYSGDVVVIDTPPGHAGVIDAAIQIADLVIIPTAPSGQDLERVFSLVDALPEGVEYCVLITMAVRNTKTLKETIDLFEEERINYFVDYITQAERYRQSFGSWPRAGKEQYKPVVDRLVRDYIKPKEVK